MGPHLFMYSFTIRYKRQVSTLNSSLATSLTVKSVRFAAGQQILLKVLTLGERFCCKPDKSIIKKQTYKMQIKSIVLQEAY